MAETSIWVDADACPKVVREILGNWVDQKAHEATLIQNVRGANGSRPEARRNAGGRAAQ